MQPLPYTRPLIKISGEALMGSGRYGIDADTLAGIATDIADVAKGGARVAVVVGGGNIFRGMSGVAHGIDRVRGDFMGMLATVMNGLALEQALKRAGQAVSLYSGLPVPSICRTFSRDDALADLERGAVVILGGGRGTRSLRQTRRRRSEPPNLAAMRSSRRPRWMESTLRIPRPILGPNAMIAWLSQRCWPGTSR